MMKYINVNIATFCDVTPRNLKKWQFSGLNCSGGFLDLFLALLTGINSLLRFLYELSKKYQVP